MSQEASHRCPIEIWRQIFHNVLVTFLLPGSNPYGNRAYDIISNIALFWESCPASHELRRVESARAALRLVCRSWNAQLDISGAGGAFGGQFAITDLQEKHWPSPPIAAPSQIRRLQITTSPDIMCRRHIPCSFRSTWAGGSFPRIKHAVQLVSDETGHPTLPCYKDEGLPNLQVLTASSQAFSGDVIGILQNSPSLTVMSLDVTPWSDGQPALSMALPGPFYKLLCLSLSGLSGSVIDGFQGDMYIPKLQLLELHFQRSTGDNTDPSNLHDEFFSRDGKKSFPAASPVRWKFPALQSLTVSGEVESHLKPSLRAFVSQYASTVTDVALLMHFVVGGQTWYRPTRISPSLRRDFPRLLIYGANISSLIDYLPSPTTPLGPLSPITILAEIHPYTIPGPPFADALADADDVLKTCIILGCDRIVLPSSWEDLSVDLVDAPYPGWDRGTINRLGLFFRKLEDGGVHVSDRSAVVFGKGENPRMGLPSHPLPSHTRRVGCIW